MRLMSSVMMVSFSGIAQPREFRFQFEKNPQSMSDISNLWNMGSNCHKHIYKGIVQMPKCAQGFWTLKGDFRGMTPITPGGWKVLRSTPNSMAFVALFHPQKGAPRVWTQELFGRFAVRLFEQLQRVFYES